MAPARAVQSERTLKLVILEETRERAEAAAPPGSAMLEVLRACREVHRAQGAGRVVACATTSNPSGAQDADDGQSASASAERMGRRQREALERAQEGLMAALARAGATEGEPPGGR